MLLRPLSGLSPQLAFLADWADVFSRNNWFYYSVYALLIFGFSYFWISIMFRPVQIADDLKKMNIELKLVEFVRRVMATQYDDGAAERLDAEALLRDIGEE